MNRYFASIKTTRVALKQLSHIVPIELTKIQEKFASVIGYQTWKEFINVNQETKESSWITRSELLKIIENIFNEDILQQHYYKIKAIISKIFLIDTLFLKEVYKKIPDKEFFFLKNTLLCSDIYDPHIIDIASPLLLNRKDDNSFNMESSIIRCFSNYEIGFHEGYLYINSSVILPHIKDIVFNALGAGLSYYVLNYVYDESIVHDLMRLLFSGHTLIFSGPDSKRYKEELSRQINHWKINNHS